MSFEINVRRKDGVITATEFVNFLESLQKDRPSLTMILKADISGQVTDSHAGQLFDFAQDNEEVLISYTSRSSRLVEGILSMLLNRNETLEIINRLTNQVVTKSDLTVKSWEDVDYSSEKATP